jgi:hypothetical protein
LSASGPIKFSIASDRVFPASFLDEGDPGGVVDADTDLFPANSRAAQLDELARMWSCGLLSHCRAAIHPILPVLIAQIVAKMPQLSEGAKRAVNGRHWILT